MQDVMVAAFACNLTNVCTLEWGASNNGQVYHWLNQSTNHHTLSHAIDEEALVVINRWLAGRVASLMDALAAQPETGGGNMLDHTLIVSGNELGVGGPHKEADFPGLLAGGRALGVRTGRYLKPPAQISTNHMLVTICRAMGLSDNQYGDPQYQGSIPGSMV